MRLANRILGSLPLPGRARAAAVPAPAADPLAGRAPGAAAGSPGGAAIDAAAAPGPAARLAAAIAAPSAASTAAPIDAPIGAPADADRDRCAAPPCAALDADADAGAALSLRQQLDLLHTALFGWPCDALTPLDDYLACTDIRQAALKMLDSDRFRWDIRQRVGLWPAAKWVLADFRGLQLWVDLADGFVSFGVLQGNWENAEADFMRSWLRPGDGMIDAGANIGVFALQAAQAVGADGKVYAFEPMRPTFAMLARSVRANGFDKRCMLYNEGLGASDGAGAIHLSTHAANPGSSTVSLALDGGGERIRIRPIDAIEYERRIRFVKIDVEGFEPYVLRGAAHTLARHAPVILTEFFPRSLREVGGISGAGYLAMLEKLGYTMSVFVPEGQGEAVSSADAHRYDGLAEPINLVCMPPPP